MTKKYKCGKVVELKWVVVLCFMVYLLRKSDCAPPYRTTTEVAVPLTTVQYWVKPTPKYRDTYDDYDYYFHEYKAKQPINSSIPTLNSSPFSPSELLMTLAKTALDIVRNINQKRALNKSIIMINNSTRSNDTSLIDLRANRTSVDRKSDDEKSRGMDHEIYYSDLPHDHYFHIPEMTTTTTTTEAPKEMMKQSRYADPWAGYYDFIINEGSFKFWSGFQLFTALLLLYSALAAIYYAKFNPIQPDYDTSYDDYFFGRSLEGSAPQAAPDAASPAPGWITSISGFGSQAYERIMDTLYGAEKKFS